MKIGYRMQIGCFCLVKGSVFLAEINMRLKTIKPTARALRYSKCMSNSQLLGEIKMHLRKSYSVSDIVLKHYHKDFAYDLGQVLRFRHALF